MAVWIDEGNIYTLPYQTVLCRRGGLTGGAVATTQFAIMNTGAAITALPAYPTGEALEVIGGAQDDSGGTGMRTVRIHYLVGTTGAVSSEVITLDGATPVPLVQTSVTRVLGMTGLTYGTDLVANGTITVQVAGAGATRMSIDPMFKSAFPGRYTIPTGYAGLYRGFRFDRGTVSATPPFGIEYTVRADIATNTGLLTTNVTYELDYGIASPAGMTGADRPAAMNGQVQVLPAGTTISAMARHDTAGIIIVGGRIFLELVTA